MIDVTKRKNVINGLYVKIQSKEGKVCKGYVRKILSKNDSAKGIKVVVESIITGRLVEGVVIDIPSKNDVQKEIFKFYNLFFSEKEYYSIINDKGEYILYDISRISSSKKLIILFTNHNLAKSFISKNDSLKGCNIKRISKKNTIQNNFKNLVFDYYLLNDYKLVSRAKFNELEKYFYIHN